MSLIRPNITDIQTGVEFRRWYWLKQELVDYCKLISLSYKGSKFEILERIAKVLDNEIVIMNPPIIRPISKFVWSKSKLSLDTLITDSYTNGLNARAFFKEHCGEKFHFSIPFMDFMKNNCGKTLRDAVMEWKRLHELAKNKSHKSDIPSGNQYNLYIRDFFADNPNKTIKEARYFWSLKRALPLGRHKYERADLEL